MEGQRKAKGREEDKHDDRRNKSLEGVKKKKREDAERDEEG